MNSAKLWDTRSIQISLALLYTNNEKPGREIKESIPFTITTKRIKYLGINLPKETKDLYTENYKTLMKEIKNDINRWRDISCSWIRRINIVKMTIYFPKQSTVSRSFQSFTFKCYMSCTCPADVLYQVKEVFSSFEMLRQ